MCWREDAAACTCANCPSCCSFPQTSSTILFISPLLVREIRLLLHERHLRMRTGWLPLPFRGTVQGKSTTGRQIKILGGLCLFSFLPLLPCKFGLIQNVPQDFAEQPLRTCCWNTKCPNGFRPSATWSCYSKIEEFNQFGCSPTRAFQVSKCTLSSWFGVPLP